MKRKIKRKYIRKDKTKKITDQEIINNALNKVGNISYFPSYLNRDKATEIPPETSGGLARIEQAALKFELAINAAIERLNKLI